MNNQQQQQQQLLPPPPPYPQQPPPPLPPDPAASAPGYDPRRLFPFGLSPIPELPSELASEVSTTCPTPSCHSDSEDSEDEEEEEEEEDDEEDEGSDTEVESVRSAGGVLYSGSGASVQSNGTLEEEDEEDEDEEDESDEDDEGTSSETESTSEDEDEEDEQRSKRPFQQCKTPVPKKTSDDDREEEDEEVTAEAASEDKAQISDVTTAPATPVMIDPAELEEISGAETASEIFRHLQATREKSEVTTELAKILNVLETTLKEKNLEESKMDEEEEDSTDSDNARVAVVEKALKKKTKKATASAAAQQQQHNDKATHSSSSSSPVTKKPPRHPNASPAKKFQSPSPSPGPSGKRSGKDEMSILSKILVTLLCSSYKSAAAASELKKIIRQFRDAAKEATDEISDEMLASATASSSSGRSSRSGRARSLRARRSSGSSSHSEAESLTNTLTPNNTDSKSSEDEQTADAGAAADAGKMRFSIKVDGPPPVQTAASAAPSVTTTPAAACVVEPTVSVTISLPRRNSVPEAVPTGTEIVKAAEGGGPRDDDCEDDDTEAELEREEEADTVPSVVESPRTKRQNQMGRNDSTSSESASCSRDLSSSEGGRSETRKLLSDMECGAYNSDSLNYSPGHSACLSDLGGNTSHEEESHAASPENGDENQSGDRGSGGGGDGDGSGDGNSSWASDEGNSQESDVRRRKKKVHHHHKRDHGGKEHPQVEGQLINHLEETFKVLNGAYKIITGSSKMHDSDGGGQLAAKSERGPQQQQQQQDDSGSDTGNNNKSFEEVLQGVTDQAVKLENEIRSKSASTPRSLQSPAVAGSSAVAHVGVSTSTSAATGARPKSQMSRAPSRTKGGGSRPASRIRSRPASRQVGGEEEEWGDEDEWEYYYEDEEEEGEEGQPAGGAGNDTAEDKEDSSKQPESDSKTTEKAKELAAPASTVVNAGKPESRPSSRQKRPVPSRPNSRPNSRTGSRPTSRASRLGMRTPGLKGIGEDEEFDDDEWEYYYEDEEEEELNRLSPAATTAPTTRATSPFPLGQPSQGAAEKQPEQKEVKIQVLEVNNPTLVSPMTTWEEVEKRQDDHVKEEYVEAREQIVEEEKVYSHKAVRSSISEVSVALAAEYLAGQARASEAKRAEEIQEEEERKSKRGKKHKHKKSKSRELESPSPGEEKSKKHKKHKKKSSKKDKDEEGKFLPRLGVRDLVSRLEPKLFKDSNSGTKMVMSRESARHTIQAKKAEEDENGASERVSVKDMVQIMSTRQEAAVADEPRRPPTFVDPMDAKGVGRVLDSLTSPQASPRFARRNLQEFCPQQAPPPPPPPINAAPVFQAGLAGLNQVQVLKDGVAHTVQMRPKKTAGRTAEQSGAAAASKSPDGSEAYGTGSSVSDDKEHQSQQQQQQQPNDGSECDSKPGSRHSRLFKLLQDSDYSDSDSSGEKASAGAGATGAGAASDRISLKSMSAMASELDSSMGSLGRRAGGRRGGRDSAADCDTASVASSFSFAKGSPIVVRKALNLNLQQQQLPPSPFDPSSSEVSTPASPGDTLERMRGGGGANRTSQQQGGGAIPKSYQQVAPTRVWSYLQDEFDANNAVSATSEGDSSYHSHVSLESLMASSAADTVEDGFGRRRPPATVGRPGGGSLARSESGRSLAGGVGATRHSPKFEMDLLELGNLPSAPGLNIRGLQQKPT